MQYSDVLLTIAEVSVAIAGFSSLITVLARRNWRAVGTDIARLRSMLVYSALATLFALFPFVLEALGATPPLVWRVSSACFGVALLIYAGWVLRIISNLKSAGLGVFYARYIVRVLVWVTISALLLNTFLPSPELNAGLYLFGLLSITSAAGFMFVRVILSLVEGERDEAEQELQ